MQSERNTYPLIRRSPSRLGLVALLLAIACPSGAAPPSTIVTWHDWGPYVGEALPDRGIAGAVAQEAFSAVEPGVTIQFRPWNRAYREARKGMHLGAFPYAYNEERARDFLFTEPLFSTSIRLFAARSHRSPSETLRTIELPSICLPQGYNTQVAENLFNESRILIKRPRAMVNCMHMLKRGRVDLVFVSERVGLFIIQQEEDLARDDYFILSRRFEEPVHIMVSRELSNAQSLVDTLDQQLAEMKANGRIKAIFKHFDATIRDSR